MQFLIYYHQISTIDEIIENNFRLAGSQEVFTIIAETKKVTWMCLIINICVHYNRGDIIFFSIYSIKLIHFGFAKTPVNASKTYCNTITWQLVSLVKIL